MGIVELNNKRKKFLLLFYVFFIVFLSNGNAQNKEVEDSLFKNLKNAKSSVDKAKALNAISYELSAKNPEKALSFAKQAFVLSSGSENLTVFANSNFNIGSCYDYLFNLDSAMYYYQRYLDIGISIKDSTIISHGHNLVGSVYIYLGNYPKALEKCMLSLNIAEKRNDFKNIGTSANNIGNVFYFQNKPKLALKYWLRALDYNLKQNNKKNAAIILCNIGAYYNDNSDYKNALIYLNRALALQNEIGNLSGKANTLTNIGLAYYDQNLFKESLNHFYEALSISDKLNDDFAKISQYNNIGFSNLKLNNYKEAINAFLIADSICIKHKSPDGRKSSLEGLSQAYEMINDYKSAYTYNKLLFQVSDSLLNSESTQQVAELETKYQTEKKETENKLLKTENLLSTETIHQQKIITYFIITGLILVSVLAYFIFRGLKNQRKANNIISEQKEIVEKQKHIVEEKHKEITDSINYAERIQRSFLATKELLDENLGFSTTGGSREGADYFVLFQPKDVVSGDFYWGKKLSNGNFALVTADSTGHGVPGAIMSLLNITSLELAVKDGNTQPEDILNATRKTIIERLKKDGSAEGGKDGMDCILTIYDFKNNKLLISAANNPIWIARGSEVIEIKADKMPVGKHDKQDVSFTKQEIDIKKGDVIYTLTDGFPDQFGGENGKKFMSKKLRELLVTNASLTMQEQKQLLQTTFNNWVGDLEQVDDVCLIGVRV